MYTRSKNNIYHVYLKTLKTSYLNITIIIIVGMSYIWILENCG